MRVLLFGLRLLFLSAFAVWEVQDGIRRRLQRRKLRQLCSEADYSKDDFGQSGWHDVDLSADNWKAQLDDAVARSKERNRWLSPK